MPTAFCLPESGLPLGYANRCHRPTFGARHAIAVIRKANATVESSKSSARKFAMISTRASMW